MIVETEAARLLTYRCAAQKDDGFIHNTLETCMAKYYACEVASRVADGPCAPWGPTATPASTGGAAVARGQAVPNPGGLGQVQKMIIATDAWDIERPTSNGRLTGVLTETDGRGKRSHGPVTGIPAGRLRLSAHPDQAVAKGGPDPSPRGDHLQGRVPLQLRRGICALPAPIPRLAGLGMKKGSKVIAFEWNTHRHFEIYFAVPGMGAILQMGNPS